MVETKQELINEISKLNSIIELKNAEILKLTEISYLDALTGVFNRRAYMEKRITYNDCFVVIVDINNLKKINDTYGHKAGDERILFVANFIKNAGDVYRIGGDEFIVICKNIESVEKIISNDLYCAGFSYLSDFDSFDEAVKHADADLLAKKKNVIFR